MKRLNEHEVSAAYRAAETKLLILNFDTVLAVQDNPAHVNVDALPSHLSLEPGARVIVTSSHTPSDMSMLVREPRVIAIAENGGFIRRPGALGDHERRPTCVEGPHLPGLVDASRELPRFTSGRKALLDSMVVRHRPSRKRPPTTFGRVQDRCRRCTKYR